MKKWLLALLCLCALCLTGCVSGSTGNVRTAPATPSPTASLAPSLAPTMVPGTPEPTALPGMTPAESGQIAEKISEAVERISEVEDAEVIVNNERVLVAVKFDEQYSAGLDTRMKDTIIETVRKVDNGIEKVQVTDDDTLYGKVKSLGERIANVTGLDELADDFGDLWDRIVGR